MPVIQGEDHFAHGDFAVPGGGGYIGGGGAPAKDTTIVRPGDLASLLIDVVSGVEYVTNGIAGSPPLWWQAFGWRMEAESTFDADVAQMTPAAGTQLRLSYGNSPNCLYLFFPGGTTVNGPAYTLGTWSWVELIFDASANPNRGYWQVNGVDQTSVSLAQAASVGSNVQLGEISGDTETYRLSCHLWGIARSPTDWLGVRTYDQLHNFPTEVVPARKFGPF